MKYFRVCFREMFVVLQTIFISVMMFVVSVSERT